LKFLYSNLAQMWPWRHVFVYSIFKRLSICRPHKFTDRQCDKPRLLMIALRTLWTPRRRVQSGDQDTLSALSSHSIDKMTRKAAPPQVGIL